MSVSAATFTGIFPSIWAAAFTVGRLFCYGNDAAQIGGHAGDRVMQALIKRSLL
jgi:hypothetical protein